MTIRRLEKPQWRPFLMPSSNCSRPRTPRSRWPRSIWVTRRRQNGCRCLASATINDVVDIVLDGLDHMISKPREIYLDNGAAALTRLEIVDADGVRQDSQAQGSIDAASAADLSFSVLGAASTARVTRCPPCSPSGLPVVGAAVTHVGGDQ